MKKSIPLVVVGSLVLLPVYYIYKFYETVVPSFIAVVVAISVVLLYISLLVIATTESDTHRKACKWLAAYALLFEISASVHYLVSTSDIIEIPTVNTVLMWSGLALHGCVTPLLLYNYIELLLDIYINKNVYKEYPLEYTTALHGVKVETIEDTTMKLCPKCKTPLSMGQYRQAQRFGYCSLCKPTERSKK